MLSCLLIYCLISLKFGFIVQNINLASWWLIMMDWRELVCCVELNAVVCVNWDAANHKLVFIYRVCWYMVEWLKRAWQVSCGSSTCSSQCGHCWPMTVCQQLWAVVSVLVGWPWLVTLLTSSTPPWWFCLATVHSMALLTSFRSMTQVK